MEKCGMNKIPEGIPRFYRFALNVSLRYTYTYTEDPESESIADFNILAIENLGTDLSKHMKVNPIYTGIHTVQLCIEFK